MKTENQIETFLNDSEISKLTGRKMKSLQIEALRKMGIPFFVCATGHPVVARSILDGKRDNQVQPKAAWKSNVLKEN